MKSDFLLLTIAFLAIAMSTTAQETGAFTDSRDNKTYKTVKIGKQIWMAENLNFITGDGSWCYNDSTKYCNMYGRMYDWETAKKVCPAGWHLPSEAEWKVLIDGLGGSNEAGGKMKITGTDNWKNPNFNADNSSGFNGLPSGYRTYSDFSDLGNGGGYWSATSKDKERAGTQNLYYDNGDIGGGDGMKIFAYSVRCLKN